ncbi:copper resistance protein NlpE N-terminal domain-containing protein [Fluviicola sp.]|uniref:copper resistance protein NlpE N-terminal domain-containing protein n=1 Tax=Fluviicola sp. TaxID=1917219 RepID=UPI0031D5D0EA
MKNRINYWGIAVSSMLLLNTSCIEHRSDEKPYSKANVANQEEEKYLHDKDYDTFRIYEGAIPCEDCSGIEQRLVVKGDTMGIFRLTETYKDATEDGDATIVCSGQWKKVKQKNRDLLILSQGTLKDSVRRMEYEMRSNELMQRSLDGEYVKHPNLYQLKLVRKSKSV